MVDLLVPFVVLAVTYVVIGNLLVEKGQKNVSGKMTIFVANRGELIWRPFFWLDVIRLRKRTNNKVGFFRLSAFSVIVFLALNIGNALFFFGVTPAVWRLEKISPVLGTWKEYPVIPVVWCEQFTDSPQSMLRMAGYYLTLWPVTLYIVNKSAEKLFSHSQLAKLVETVILYDKVLPDDYKTVVQLNTTQVLIDYSISANQVLAGNGEPPELQKFTDQRKQMAEMMQYEIDVEAGDKNGIVLITFRSPYRKKIGDWRFNEGKNSYIRDKEVGKNEKQRYVYALFTDKVLSTGDRVLKLGICTDIDGTLSQYQRGGVEVKFLFVLKEGNGLNEASLFDWFGNFRVRVKNRKGGGEFFRECDDFYIRYDQLVVRYSNNITLELKKSYFSHEALSRELS